MTDPDVGPQPDPQPEPGPPAPGGADAIEHDTGADAPGPDSRPLSHDPHPDENPSTDQVPGEMKRGEDTSTEATEAGDSGETAGGTSSEESPA